MNNDLITIIVPIYNVEKYLNQCITSILNQTYRNLEIILVDDGSPDNCGKICDGFSVKDKRIKVIHKKNEGLSVARNCGIENSKGKYIIFIDADDYIEKNYIEKLYEAIIKNNVKISQCNIIKVKEDGNVFEKIGYSNNQIKTGKELIKEIYEGHWIENVVVWNKMYDAELFKEIRYPKGKIHEDEFLTYKIIYFIDKIAIIDEYLYNYRQREDSITGKKFNIKRLDVLDAFEEKMIFFKEKDDIQLYQMTQKQYLLMIIEYYNKTLQNIEENKDILSELVDKYKKEYKLVKQNKYIGLKHNIKMKIFYIIQSIKRKINIRIKAIKEIKKYQAECKKIGQKEFYIFNSPIHGNIGDHAIIYSEYKILKELNIKAFEIPTYQEKYYFNYIRQKASRDAIISITGGGFIGSQWLEEQNLVDKVIKTFKKNKIIIFPSTFYFKDNEQKSIKIIRQVKDINIFLRESKSFEFVKNNLKNAKIHLVPDIVLALKNEWNYNYERKGILLCLRKDVEGVISDSDKQKIYDLLKKYDKEIEAIDTVVDYEVFPKNRKKEIEIKIKQFASSKIVVTDRLHGLIFAVITNTPCIVFRNYNHKVERVYQDWIKDNIENVIFVEDIKKVGTNLEKVINKKNNRKIEFDFTELINILEENISG